MRVTQMHARMEGDLKNKGVREDRQKQKDKEAGFRLVISKPRASGFGR